MSVICIPGGASGGSSDECTAKLSDIPTGLKAVTVDSNDEAGVGTMTMTGNAQASHVLAGETFYTNNYKTKLTGTMTVNSLLSFSVAAYSGRRVLAKWQNPNQAAGKPFSGVIIRYSTSGYPETTGGTQIYKGAGNNTAAGAWSQTYLDMPALNTTYYFSCYPYVTTVFGVIYGAVRNVTCKTSAVLNKTITASTAYTIPAGYSKMDLFAVGGGGGTGTGSKYVKYGNGGASGFTKTVTGITVSPGQTLAVVVGAGGTGSNAKGGSSSVSRNGTILCTVNGGSAGSEYYDTSSKGGSGAGTYGNYDSKETYGRGGNGGSDGQDGETFFEGVSFSKGQGTTTRAWGIPSATLYAGGGGGGSASSGFPGGVGGAGGGGHGGTGISSGTRGRAGTPNTGGGAGGIGFFDRYDDATGGSGIVLMKIY